MKAYLQYLARTFSFALCYNGKIYFNLIEALRKYVDYGSNITNHKSIGLVVLSF
jgi:hypothetical protein